MNDDGYTLAEVLAAMVMIGLAMGGMTMGVRVIGHVQAAAARAGGDASALRNIQVALAGVVSDQGPFSTKQPDAFTGSARIFSFDCGKPSPCGAKLAQIGDQQDLQASSAKAAQTLPVPGVTSAHFVYASQYGLSDTWPPSAPEAQVLRSVSLVRDGAGGAPIASARIWRQQPADCAFDPVSGDCRSPAP